MRWCLVLILMIPAASAGAPVDLYWHLNSALDAPMNTQAPEHTADPGTWAISSNSGCLDNPVGPGLTGKGYHTRYGFPSPGRVEYADGEARIYPERGIGLDLAMDQAPAMTVYMLARSEAPILGVVIDVDMLASDDISVQHEAIDNADLVASGTSGPHRLHPETGGDYSVHHTAEGVVYGFEVPLELHKPVVTKAESFSVRVTVRMDNPHCNGDTSGSYIMPNLLQVYSGEGLWNRVSLSVAEPLVVDYVHPLFVEADLVIHVGIKSLFGRGDLHPDTNLTVRGPGGQFQVVGQHEIRTHEHHPPAFVPALTYAIPIPEENGEYSLHVQLWNLQNTFSVERGLTLTVVEEGATVCHDEGPARTCTTRGADVEVPFMGAVWLVALLGLAARRRGIQA